MARIIFEKGEDRGYGLMFRSIFHFTPLIKHQNKAILLDTYKRLGTGLSAHSENLGETLHADRAYQIGIHIRHSNNKDIGNGTNFESVESKCIRSILSEQDIRGKKCILMVFFPFSQFNTFSIIIYNFLGA